MGTIIVMQSFHNVYKFQIIVQYAWNQHNIVGQLHLN